MGNCLTTIEALPTMLRKGSVVGTDQELTSLLLRSSDATTDGLHIQVGRSVDAKTIHIPYIVLSSCSVLKSHLRPGCRIIDADPAVFAIIIEHLQSFSIFELISFSAYGHLQELTLGDNPLLNFAKAWHVGDMLRMPDLQNNILQVFSTHYGECRKRRLDGPLNNQPVDPQPFAYLRDNIATHTKAERFLVDFHAGLMRHRPKLTHEDFALLPTDIELNIRDRCEQLRARRDSGQPVLNEDRIAARDRCFRVNKNEMAVHSQLHVQYLCAGPMTSFGLNPPTAAPSRRTPAPRRSASRGSNSSDTQYGTRLEDLMARRQRHRIMRSRITNGADSAGTGVLDTTARPVFTIPFDRAESQQRQPARTTSPSPSVSPGTVPPNDESP